MKLLIFTFRHTIAERITSKLELPSNKMYLDSSIEAIEHFVSSTDFSQYTHILGLGTYSGRDQDKIRIETVCTSQFRNRKEDLQTVRIPYFMQPNDHMKLAKGMSNSWCNLVSYRLLKERGIDQYTFLHIPRYFDVDVAVKVISD